MSQENEYSPREVMDALYEVRMDAPIAAGAECAQELARITGLEAHVIEAAPHTRNSQLEQYLTEHPEEAGHVLGVITRYRRWVGAYPGE